MADRYRHPNGRLLFFARAPRPGATKTRLVPAMGAAAAAALQAAMTRRAVTLAVAAALAPVELWCAPDPRHPLFRELGRLPGVSLHAQGSGALGERMASALEDALSRSCYALLCGTDCPALDAGNIDIAMTSLASGTQAVMIPAEDGGYVAIGLDRPAPGLFDSVAWGSDAVAAETRGRLRKSGLVWREQAALWDVDRPADLERLRRAFPQLLAAATPSGGAVAHARAGG